MRGQSKDHATLQKLCSKFHWLSVPLTVFQRMLDPATPPQLAASHASQGQNLSAKLPQLEYPKAGSDAELFWNAPACTRSHGEIEALLLEVLRCGVKALAARRYRARLQNLSRSAKVRWQVWGMDACQSFKPDQSRPKASSSFSGRPAASA